MNTKNIDDKAERKKLKRTARKKAAPKPRAADVARGSQKNAKSRRWSRASASVNRRVPSPALRTKSIDDLIAASEEPARRLRKTLGPWSLTALGIGTVIGSGIFTVTGTAAAGKTKGRGHA